MLTFDSEKHLYLWNGVPVPSVTQIIHEWMEVSVYGERYFVNRFTGTAISADPFRAAGGFGTAVHAGAKLLAEGNALDYDALHPSLHHPLDEFVRWQTDYSPEYRIIEKPLYSAKFNYAGTPDIIAIIRRRLAVVDIKTGGYDMAGVQMAGYEQLYREEVKRGALHMDRYVLFLPKNDGERYQFIQLRDITDHACFMALWDAGRQMKGRIKNG